MFEPQVYYILGILRPEHPTIFVAMPFDTERKCLKYEQAWLPKDAYRFSGVQFARAIAQQLMDGKADDSKISSRLAYEFRRKVLTYEPYIDTDTKQPDFSEPADWETKIIEGCELYIQEISGPGDSRIIEKHAFTL